MELSLAKIFQTGMILQREKPVMIYGQAEPGEVVTVTIQGKSEMTQAGESGIWRIVLPSLNASEQESLEVTGESKSIRIEDVAVGEVFVAGGQSNMEFWMRYEKHYREGLEQFQNPNIRFYDVPKISYPGQERDFDYHRVGIWRKAMEEDLDFFSAVGFYFACRLESALSVPVGIIGCNFGGTRSSAWMKEEHACQLQPEQAADFERSLKGQSYEQFCKAAGNNPANDTGNSQWNPFNEFILPSTPGPKEIAAFFGTSAGDVPSGAKPQNAPGALYRYMTLAAAPFTVRGVLWYQGESDDEIDGTQKNYQSALEAIIADWRAAWSDKQLPFLIVQLPGYRTWLGFDCKDFITIREAQRKAAEGDANVWLCSISDAGEEMDIHPKDKRTVGERLARLAEQHIFEQPVLADPPICQSAMRDGKEITLLFENAGTGLIVKGNQINALSLSAAGREVRYHWRINENQLILMIDENETTELDVSFAMTSWYRVNLYNSEGIPAIPFRLQI